MREIDLAKEDWFSRYAVDTIVSTQLILSHDHSRERISSVDTIVSTDLISSVEWCLKYERLMARVTAAHGNAAQLLILDAEAAVLAQDGQDRFAA